MIVWMELPDGYQIISQIMILMDAKTQEKIMMMMMIQ